MNTKSGIEVLFVSKGLFNAYFIKTNTLNILVDTGISSNYSAMLKFFVDNSIDTIDYLILTHTHYDHCQNAALLKEKFNLKIIADKAEVQYAQQGYTDLPKGTNLITRFMSFLGRLSGGSKFRYTPFIVDCEISDDACSLLKECRVSIMQTPGHSLGSLSVIVDDEIAIVGDTLFGVFKKSVFPPYSDNVPQMILSWQQLLNTNCSQFLPGHGAPINRELFSKQFKRYAQKYVPN